jgi:hypothetical protein
VVPEKRLDPVREVLGNVKLPSSFLCFDIVRFPPIGRSVLLIFLPKMRSEIKIIVNGLRELTRPLRYEL